MRGPELRFTPPGLILLLLSTSPAPTAEAPSERAAYRYAVLPFVFSPSHRDLQWLTEAFALTIADRLEMLGFTVASRRERVETADAAGVASPSPATLASRLKLARALRAGRAVTGTLTFAPAQGDSVAAQITVQTMILDVERGRILHQRTITGTLNELYSMIDEIALEVAWEDPSPPGPEARQILKEIDDPPLPSFEAVIKALTEKDPDRQAAALETAKSAARDHPMLVRRLADALIEAGRVDDALARLQTLDPSRQPDPWRFHLDRAEILLARGDLEEAAAAAAHSLAARDTAAAHIVMARVALARGDRPAAENEARLATAIDPEHPALPGLRRQIAGKSGATDRFRR